MRKKNWGIFVMEHEVEQTKEVIEQKGYEVFEVRKLTYWEKILYCKDSILVANEPWIIMFKSTSLQYNLLKWKLRLSTVF